MTIERNEHIIAIGRIIGPATVLLAFLAFYLWYTGRIDGLAALGIALMGPVLGIGVGILISKGGTVAGRALTDMLVANFDLPPGPSFSHQEALVARGEIQLARESYETHVAEHPADLDARLALAALWRDQLRDGPRAIELYLEARRLGPNRRQAYAIANALIDLYDSTGNPGRKLAELARLAEEFKDTEAGVRAREAVRRLKSG